MGSGKPYRSWRQKGIAATIAGAILWPVVDGVVQEKAPEGIFAALNRTQPIEAEREPTTLENRIDTFFSKPAATAEPAAPDLSTFDYRARSVEPSPENAHRLATSLVNLQDVLEPIGRVAAQTGVPENLLYTIATIESGGSKLIPNVYRDQVTTDQVPPDVPEGLFHAKLVSLEEAAQTAESMRGRLEAYGVDLPTGWPSIEEARAIVPEDVYVRLIEDYTQSLGVPMDREDIDRHIQLAAQVPEGAIENRLDPEQSARGAVTYLAQIDAHLQAAGIEEVTLAQLLAGYTGGHNGVRRAAPQNNDDTIGRAVANTNGAWYTATGEQTYTLLERYSSIDDALSAAQELAAFRESRPDATTGILGSLYVQAATDPNAFGSFDAYIVDQRALDTSRWVPIAEIWDSYQHTTALASR